MIFLYNNEFFRIYNYYISFEMKNEEIKIVTIGDGTVGKTCLTLYYKDK